MEPYLNICFNVIEQDVRHTTHDILDQKYVQAFRMSYLAFEQLVLELTLFLESIVAYVVRPPILVQK